VTVARGRLLAWGPPALYAAGIFALSSLPHPPAAEALKDHDGWFHLVEYAVLGLLVARAFLHTRPAWSRAAVVAASAAACGAYGLTDEIHQSFVPPRSVQASDVVSDLVGGLAGAAAWAACARPARRSARA